MSILTRDNAIWTLTILGSLIVYLAADGRSPAEWAYIDWVKFSAAVVATLSANLKSSPLKHSGD